MASVMIRVLVLVVLKQGKRLAAMGLLVSGRLIVHESGRLRRLHTIMFSLSCALLGMIASRLLLVCIQERSGS